MPLQPNSPAPYTSAPAVLTVLARSRTNLPGTITSDLLIRYGVKESIVPRTIQALRLLDLTDDTGKPTPALESLAKAKPDDYKAELASHLRSVYADVFALVDPASADTNALRNAFWGYEPRGQVDAMIRLFLGLCEEAGIVEARPATTAAKANTRTAATTTRSKPPPPPPPRRKEVIGDASTPSDLPPGLVGLLRQIPTGGKSWTTERRDAFLSAFAAVLNFTIPTDDNPVADLDDEEPT